MTEYRGQYEPHDGELERNGTMTEDEAFEDFERHKPENVAGHTRRIKHWVISRKAAIILAVRSGDLLLPDILREHNISTEEWFGWCADYDAGGKDGLRSTLAGSR